MKIKSYLIIFLLCVGTFYLNAQSDSRMEEATYSKVEQMPEFPGCESENDVDVRRNCAYKTMIQYLGENIAYPADAKKEKKEGTVIISFVVNKKGEITNSAVAKGFDSACDAEALRVVNSMPKWNPGMEQGKEVAVHMNLPIRFSL